LSRTVFLTHSGADSGAEQCTVSYLAHWPESEEMPLLLLAEHGPIEDRARAAGVTTLTIRLHPAAAGTRRGERGPLRLLGMVARLAGHASRVRAVLGSHSADTVVAFSLKAMVFGWLAGRRSGATVVWSLHDRVSRDYFPTLLVPVLRHLGPRLVDGIMVNSRATLSTIRPGRTPVAVATPPIELDPREFHEPAEEVRRVVMLGRLSPWKAQDLFLGAFAEVFADTSAEAYVVGGALFGEDDYAEGLRAQVRDLGLEDRVHFVGHVEDPWAWLVDADVLVHCSRIPEPFGQVVVQGLWARCAVVAASPGGPTEVVTDGWDALLAPGGDGSALIDALARLRDDVDLRRALARHGRLTAARYDAALAAPRLAAWLTDLHLNRLAPRSVLAVVPTGGERR
jgi:glycosyltransferase involved in cell wall biosynthesis